MDSAAYKSRVAAAVSRYYDTHDVAGGVAELQADNARQAKRAARLAAGRLTEHEEQALVCDWLDAKCLRYFSVPNGKVLKGMSGTEIAKYMAYLRREGLRRGAPDIVIVDPVPGCRAPVCVEMKSVTGTVSPEQRAFLDDMEARGWKVIVARGHEEAIRRLEEIYG